LFIKRTATINALLLNFNVCLNKNDLHLITWHFYALWYTPMEIFLNNKNWKTFSAYFFTQKCPNVNLFSLLNIWRHPISDVLTRVYKTVWVPDFLSVSCCRRRWIWELNYTQLLTVTDFKIFSGFSRNIPFIPSLSNPFLIRNSSKIPKRDWF
jgi:hypothetical protein